MNIEPPPRDSGPEPLFRVVYIIDVNAVDPLGAANKAYEIMVDPNSLAPVLQVLDHSGKLTVIDLSDDTTPAPAA
jgi:hypothetical protein